MNNFSFYRLLTTSGVLVASLGCTPAFIPKEERIHLLRQVETRPYVAVFEGLQPESGYRMKNIANMLNRFGYAAFATSGNPSDHLPQIREAYAHNQKINIIGFSLGEIPARHLASLCNNEGIGIETLFLIDGTKTGAIARNVHTVIDIRGSNPPYVFRRNKRYGPGDLMNPETTINYYDVFGEHLDMPQNASNIIMQELEKSK